MPVHLPAAPLKAVLGYFRPLAGPAQRPAAAIPSSVQDSLPPPPRKQREIVNPRSASPSPLAARNEPEQPLPPAGEAGAAALAGEVPATPGATAPPVAGVSADGLREYGLALAREARRFRRYPALARERGWAGRVEVAIAAGHLGAPPAVSLARGSGLEALDQEALAMITRAAQRAILPASLRGQQFRLVLPVEFALDD